LVALCSHPVSCACAGCPGHADARAFPSTEPNSSSVVTSEPDGTCAPPPSSLEQKEADRRSRWVGAARGQPRQQRGTPGQKLSSCVDYLIISPVRTEEAKGLASEVQRIPSKKSRFVLLQEKERGRNNLNLRISICPLRFILLLLG
jgi:hypothetical protein